MSATIDQAVAAIRARAPGFAPRTGIVLGSGLGNFAAQVKEIASISYAELPGFPPTGVASHAGRLLLGTVADAPVAVMQGRAHYYESGTADAMKIPVRALAQLGCNTLLLTNAAGSLRTDVGPGSLVLISDHINFTGVSPLFGETGSQRFVDMVDAYDPALRRHFHAVAQANAIMLHDGVYIWFAGPQFETPAEIRAAGQLGADMVGMSTVPEVILARHAGMRVAALSIITNFAAGMTGAELSHEHTLQHASAAEAAMSALLTGFLAVGTA